MIHVVTGAPCSGKTTYIQEHAEKGDVLIDFDAIASAFGAEDHAADGDIFEIALSARKTAIASVIEQDCEAWIIDTNHREPFVEDEDLIELDPGKDVCIERAKECGRPDSTFDGIEKWYSNRKGRTMEKLYKSFELKAADDSAGTISGYFSTYDRIPDSYGDVIAPGAFTDTIKAREESGHPFPLCWNHNLDQIIGKVDKIEDDEKGPLMTASFFDTPLAQEKRAIVQSGVVYQFSFAYDVEKSAQVTLEDGTKANELQRVNLYEVSIVPIPANQNAVVTDIKSEEAEEKAEEPDVKEPEVEEKSGRRNSKADADKLEQAIALIQDVLGQLDDTEEEAEEPGEDEVKANAAAEEPEQSNPRKDALLEVITKIKEEV